MVFVRRKANTAVVDHFAASPWKVGKQSATVLLCLFEACSLRLSIRESAKVSRAYSIEGTYAFSRLVLRNVALQITH